MKFKWMIFFFTFVIIITSFGIGGFVLINNVYKSDLNDRVERVCDNNQCIALSFYASQFELTQLGKNRLQKSISAEVFAKQITKSNPNVAVLKENDFQAEQAKYGKMLVSENCYEYKILNINDKQILRVVCCLNFSDSKYFIQSVDDITDVIANRDKYIKIYQIVVVCVALLSSFMLVLFSGFITRPLEKLTHNAQKLANGDFSVSTKPSGALEIRTLSQSFNTMADSINGYVNKLEDSVKRRDAFVSDFTHEMKTPLTSIIGYSDMLRSYELSEKETKLCLDNIYKEGKRLEDLSHNLLSLIVLKNEKIDKTPLSVKTLCENVYACVNFLVKRYNINFSIECEDAYVLCEQSLITSLLTNLTDNACKAACEKGKEVKITGKANKESYIFTVRDNGIGIPHSEIDKLTQPFYMVDKSRSRKMGGAGLGLSICNEIALLHGNGLHIESKEGDYTAVSFDVLLSKNGNGGDNGE